MAKILSSEGIQSGLTINAQHISQYSNAFNGGEAYGITVSGSLTLSGSLLLHPKTLLPSSQDYILAYNNDTGKISKAPTTIIKDQARSLFTPGTSEGIITNVNEASNTITITHDNTSDINSTSNGNGNVIQNIGLDNYGHIISLNSTNLDTRYIRNITIDGNTSISKTSDGSINLFAGEGIALTAGTNGVIITSTVTNSGNGGNNDNSGGGSNENYYLSNIQRPDPNSTQLLFTIEGDAPNVTFDFGSNAFTNTTIPTNISQLNNDANFATESEVPTDEEIRDLAQGLFAGGTANGIITTVNNTNNTITIAHETKTPTNSNVTANGNVIQSLGYDDYGHISSLVSTDLDTRYMRNWKLAVNGEEINTVINAGQINFKQGPNVTLSSEGTNTIAISSSNNYLSSILRSGNNLNFIMNGNGISNPTFLFGSNAFSNDTIPTLTSQLTNDAGFALSNDVLNEENIKTIIQNSFSEGTTDGIITSINSSNDTINIRHEDTSNINSTNNNDGNVIQNIGLDTYGHITSLGSTNLDGRYIQQWYLAINDNSSEQINNSEVVRFIEGNDVALTQNGNSIRIDSTDTNYYLSGISQDNNTLTFNVNGASDQPFTFGSNAFTSFNDGTSGGIVTNTNNGIIEITHETNSPTTSTTTNNGSVVQNLEFDSYGHVSSLVSTNLDGRYMRTWNLVINDPTNSANVSSIIQDDTVTLKQGNNVTLTPNGSEITIAATDTNNYLNSITKTNNTLTFGIHGTTDQTFLFGSNAFTDTTIPTNENIQDLAQGLFANGTANGIITTVDGASNTITIAHETNSPATSNDTTPNNGNVIQSLQFDSYGHVSSLVSTNLDNRYTRNWNLVINDPTDSANVSSIMQGDTVRFIQGNNISLDSNGSEITIEATGIPTDENIQDLAQGLFANGTANGIITTVNNTNNTITIAHETKTPTTSTTNNGSVVQSLQFDSYGHVSSLVSTNLDNRYLKPFTLSVNGEENIDVTSNSTINLLGDGSTSLSRNGNDITISSTDLNYYLNSISRPQGTNKLVFSRNGIAGDLEVTFGDNAFTNTHIATVTSDLINDANFITVDGVVNGLGISTSTNNNTNTVTVSHGNTSGLTDINNNEGYVIQDLGFDDYGHVTSSNSIDLDGRYLRKDAPTSTNNIITALDFQLSSDKNLKENIKSINKSIDVDWVEYNFKDKPEEKRYGVIAQDLEKKHPEFINDSENGKTVSYIDLLVAKISELENRIKTLENASK